MLISLKSRCRFCEGIFRTAVGHRIDRLSGLGELQRATPWVWLWCEGCQHRAPLACAVAVIRWSADVSSDRLRQRARCSACGKKGATIHHPGWGGNDIGFLPFPVAVL
jgi:hypothetical protein